MTKSGLVPHVGVQHRFAVKYYYQIMGVDQEKDWTRADIFNNASIVSSIEFYKDNELFAIAGVTKRIKVYDYNVVLKDIVDIHYPSIEMVCGSKISCISWNSFHKSTLASSDYDCSIIVWDANTAQRVRTFQEHEKR